VDLTLGRKAFLIAERVFWRQTSSENGPDLSCRFNELDFEPVNAAMAAPRKSRPRASRVDYAPAVRHFERAHALSDDPVALFYLGMIALRKGKPAEARTRFNQVSAAPKTRERGRHSLRISAAVFASIATLLQEKLDQAVVAMKRASRVDPQDITMMKNQGYLCERQGERDQAVTWYQRALEWEPQDGYALRRLRALEGVPVIEIKTPGDFHVKFAEIAIGLRKIHGAKRVLKPLAASTLDKIRLSKRRGDESVTVSLPESVKTILRYDRNFALWHDGLPLLRALIGSKRVIASANIDRLVRTDRWTPYAKAFQKLPKAVAVWNDEPNLPACIPLHSNPKGEQLLFIYIGEHDASGEYPIARYQAEPELWVSEASLIHLIVSEAMNSGLRINLGCDFDKLLAKAQKRNARYEERLSDFVNQR